MNDLRALLEREEQRYELQPGGFDRLEDLRDRRRRARQTAVAVFTLLVLAVAIAGAIVLFRSSERRVPAEPPDAVLTPTEPGAVFSWSGEDLSEWVTEDEMTDAIRDASALYEGQGPTGKVVYEGTDDGVSWEAGDWSFEISNGDHGGKYVGPPTSIDPRLPEGVTYKAEEGFGVGGYILSGPNSDEMIAIHLWWPGGPLGDHPLEGVHEDMVFAIASRLLEEMGWVPLEPPESAGCPPGSTPDEPGPLDQARPYRGGPMTFDRDAHRIVLLTGLASDQPARAQLWAFDVCSNTWARLGPEVPLSDDDDDPALGYDAGTDRILVFGAGSVWAYDVPSETWSRSEAPTTATGLYGPQAVLDPITGRWIVRDHWSAEMWSYDAGADAWREIEQRGEIPLLPGPAPWQMDCFAQFLSYDSSADRLVLYLGYCAVRGGPRGGTSQLAETTWEFDLRTRTWSQRSIETPELWYGYLPDPGRSHSAYDEANARTVVLDWYGLTAYDASAHRWKAVSTYARQIALLHGFDSVVYDPVNARFVLYGGDQDDVWLDDVWAFDLETRTWTQLLAPSG